jgi:hypothetical protein
VASECQELEVQNGFRPNEVVGGISAGTDTTPTDLPLDERNVQPAVEDGTLSTNNDGLQNAESAPASNGNFSQPGRSTHRSLSPHLDTYGANLHGQFPSPQPTPCPQGPLEHGEVNPSLDQITPQAVPFLRQQHGNQLGSTHNVPDNLGAAGRHRQHLTAGSQDPEDNFVPDNAQIDKAELLPRQRIGDLDQL